MKLIVVISIYFVTTLITLAQGTVHFSNRVPAAGLVALAAEWCGNDLLGSNYFAQLYAGRPATDEGSLTPVGVPVRFKDSSRTGLGLGWFDGGAVTIPNIPPGGGAVVQVRWWDSAGGATYEEARTSGKRHFKSEPVSLGSTGNPLSEPPTTPVDLIGLRGLSPCPEPSPLALGVLGAAILWLWRRQTIARR